MINGAVLTIAAMDIMKLYGAAPANFLDVGGGTSTEKATADFKIITSDSQVKGILVNILIGKCDVMSLLKAWCRQLKISGYKYL